MLFDAFFAAAAAVSLLMLTLFTVSVFIKRNDIVDIAWGPGIFLVTVATYLVTPSPNLLNQLIVLLIGLWAFRLAFRIFRRNRGKEEDYRYKQWREEWGSWVYVRSFFQVYVLQGFLMLVLGAPALLASHESEAFTGFGTLSFLGIAVWLVGFYFEVVGDKQLDDFIANRPKDKKVLDTGLWKYTRHPNYFGEVTMWWGIWLMVAPLPMSYVALISPLVITYLILFVSGVPMLERKFAGDPAYEAYKEKTSVFLPLPPKTK